MFPIIGSLFVGWFLSLFGFDNLVINGAKEIFDITITMSGYYFMFAVIGAINWLLMALKKG